MTLPMPSTSTASPSSPARESAYCAGAGCAHAGGTAYIALLVVWPAAAVVPAMAVALVMHLGVRLVHFLVRQLSAIPHSRPAALAISRILRAAGKAIVLARESLRHANLASGRSVEVETYGLCPRLFMAFSARGASWQAPGSPGSDS